MDFVPSGISQWSSLATIIGVPIGVFAVFFAGLQLKRTLAVERGKFLLELERMLALHNAAHIRLRPGGDWSPAGTNLRFVNGPDNPADFAQIEDYMGFFEHCEILIRTGCVDVTTFEKLFGYRVANILANPLIAYYKLNTERQQWGDFISLAKRLRLEIPDVEEDEVDRIHRMKACERSKTEGV